MFEDDFQKGIDFQAVLASPVFHANCSPAKLKRYRKDSGGEDDMNDDLQRHGSEALCVSWEGGESPCGGGGGSITILEWNGLYFVTSTDWGECGPYKTFQEANSHANLDAEISGGICVSCSELSDAKLKARALDLVGDQEVVILNGVGFIRRGAILVKATKKEIEAANVATDSDEDKDDKSEE